jgi:predicted DNA repair protein MutK
VHDISIAAGESMPAAASLVEWVVTALGSAVVGLVVGGVIVTVMHLLPKRASRS